MEQIPKNTCDICGRVINNLTRHKRLHLGKTRGLLLQTLGERPFTCEYCPYRSSRKDHYQRHMQNKHKSKWIIQGSLCRFKDKYAHMAEIGAAFLLVLFQRTEIIKTIGQRLFFGWRAILFITNLS